MVIFKTASADMLIILVAVFTSVCGETCPYEDSLWRAVSGYQERRLLSKPQVSLMDDRCYTLFFNRAAESDGLRPGADILLSSLREYCAAKNVFSRNVLFAVSHKLLEEKIDRINEEVVLLWERYNGRFREVLNRLESRGMYLEIDSLYTSFQALGRCDLYDMLQWTETKTILNDYKGASRLFCEIYLKDERLAGIAKNKFYSMLTDASDRDRLSSITEFLDCSLPSIRKGRGGLLQWLSAAYGEFGFFREEYETILHYAPDSAAAGRLLLDAAERRFVKGLFKETIEPAGRAYRLAADANGRKRCAVLLYQSYLQLNNTDSALVWFGRSGLTDRKSIVSVAVLFQNAGLFQRADSMIRSLPPSFERDTLSVRQDIMTGDLSRAYERTMKFSETGIWKSYGRESSLWKIRTAVFKGDIAGAVAHIDSAEFSPDWEHAREILNYKYAAHQAGADPAAFAYWGKIQCAIYSDRAASLADTLDVNGYLPPIRELCVVALAEELIRKRQAGIAEAVLSRIPKGETTARVEYYRAEAAFMKGEIEKARKLLDQLILSFPQDVFSDKARIYLLGLNQKHNM